MTGIFKKSIYLILLISYLMVFISMQGYCAEQATDSLIVLSLERAIEITFCNNKQIQAQQQEIKMARAGIVAARSRFLPKLNLDGEYTYTESVLNLNLPPAEKDQGIFSGYKDDNILTTSISESIYKGGGNIAKFKTSELELSVQMETLRAIKLNAEFEVKRLYYGLLLAYENKRIMQNLVDQARLHCRDVEKKFRQGTASRFDLLQSRVHVSKIIPGLIKAETSIDLIKAELKKVLSLDMRDSIELVDQRLVYSPIKINEQLFLARAYTYKPEMILKFLGIDISKWLIKLAKAGYGPNIDAGGGYMFRSSNLSNMFNERHNNWSASITFNIPVFDGFYTKAKVDEAKANYARANLEKEDMAEQIAVDIRRGCLDLIKASSIIDSQKDHIEEAQEALRLSIVSYDNGVGINLDVLDAQVSLSEVENNLAEGIYDYIMAEAYLDKTMGQELLEVDAE